VKCVPDFERQSAIISNVHCGVGFTTEAKAVGGHFGRDKMLHAINTRWLFPLITERVTRFLKYCDTCQRSNTYKLQKSGATLHPVEVPEKIWSKIGVDILQMPEAHGFKYIVTAVDYYTKWPEAAALPDKSGVSVARFLWAMHCRYGAADIWISDQGREFVNSMTKELYRLCGVQHRITSAYHPQANGLVERQNRTTEGCIKKACEDRMDDWPFALDSVLLSVRTSKHASTGYTPFRLMFMRDPVIAAEVEDDKIDIQANNIDPPPSPHQEPPVDLEEKVEKLEQMKQQMMSQASSNIKNAQKKQVNSYNIRHASQILSVGDRVLKKNVKDAVRLQKGCAKWLGPYTIVDVTDKGMVRLKRDGHIAAKLVPPQHVKLYYSLDAENPDGLSDDDLDAFTQSSLQSSISTAAAQKKRRTVKKSKHTAQNSSQPESQPASQKSKHTAQNSSQPESQPASQKSKPKPKKRRLMTKKTAAAKLQKMLDAEVSTSGNIIKLIVNIDAMVPFLI
jgi:hypothetical protein